MWELASGVIIMLGLFAILLGGLIVLGRRDEADVDLEDLAPASRVHRPAVELTGRAVTGEPGVTAPPVADAGSGRPPA